jgi:peptidoglycan-N-acetylglucosamine deacetylase
MRYRLFGVLRRRQLLATLLVLFILPAALQSCGRLWRPQSVAANVVFMGREMGGLSLEEARSVLSRLAGELHLSPVNAFIDGETGGVIPDLSGRAMDEGETLARLLAASRGTEVQPVIYDLPAKIRLQDFPVHPLYRGNPEKPQVTFLINVAWGNEYLEEMLDVLRETGAEATFFLVGRWVRGNRDAANAIAAAGFELANHGDSDAISMQNASFPQALEDIRRANDTIEEVWGQRPVYFSPHRGELTDTVLKAAAEESCRTVMWTVDTVDWKLPGVDVMLEKILGRAEGGSLILMHPTEQTAEFLRRVIPALREKGLEPVTLSTLLDPVRDGVGP